MGRPKKIAESKPSAAAALHSRIIDVESFIRVRDSVAGRLGTIQELIKSFTVDYIRQTNLLLGEPTPVNAGYPPTLNFDTAAAAFANFSVLGGTAPADDHSPIKERKKRRHDLNAPKRPLTPYFLYMSHAREIIYRDLGGDAKGGAVMSEGLRRWSNMSSQEKQSWYQSYDHNLRLYLARQHAYKNGNADAKNMSEEDAVKLADQLNIELPDKNIRDLEPSVEHLSPLLDDERSGSPELNLRRTPPIEKKSAGLASASKKSSNRKRKSLSPDSSSGSESPEMSPSPSKKPRHKAAKAPDVTVEPEKEAKKSGRKKIAKRS